MDKNIAALLRQDTKTVHVSFDQVANDFDELNHIESPTSKKYAAQSTKPPSAKTYLYVTDMNLAIGDTVIVDARGNLALAFVHVVDDDVKIEPNSNTQYKWVIAKIDLTSHVSNMERNVQIEQAVAEAYRNNVRRSFAQQILSGVDDAHRNSLQRLLGAPDEVA